MIALRRHSITSRRQGQRAFWTRQHEARLAHLDHARGGEEPQRVVAPHHNLDLLRATVMRGLQSQLHTRRLGGIEGFDEDRLLRTVRRHFQPTRHSAFPHA